MEKDHLLIKKLVTLLYVTVGGGGRGGWSNWKFWEKNPQVYLIIIREWPKNTSPPPAYLRRLDNLTSGTFYSNHPPPSPYN